MPFYEYECSNCKYYTEVLQKLSDAPLRKCPSCGKNTFRKLVSAPVFRLKGSGWYETDFKGDKDNKRNLAGDQAPSSDDKSAGGKAEGEKKDPAGKAEGAKAEGAKGETAKAEAAKPAAEKPAAAGQSPSRSRRGSPAPRVKAAPAKATPAKGRKKSRR